ncbi:MAG TPA: nitrilase-related carbon-nitrogen hydrolase, partial [Fimbriimonas sp.]|nr:nitrilase-related carbon-nitrogen hydrolase [Fimbriimonas sp.]
RGEETADLDRASVVLPLVTSWPDSSKPIPFNIARLISNGNSSESYRKRKLFGGETKQHQPGNKPVAVPFENHQMGLNICFDSCFPSVIRETARMSDFVALPTIDPESPHGFLAAMHAAYTPIRSAETGMAIYRADGYAYSMATDGYGNVVAETGIGPSVTLAPFTTPDKTRPIAMWVGDGVLWLCGAAFIAGCFWKPKQVDA